MNGGEDGTMAAHEHIEDSGGRRDPAFSAPDARPARWPGEGGGGARCRAAAAYDDRCRVRRCRAAPRVWSVIVWSDRNIRSGFSPVVSSAARETSLHGSSRIVAMASQHIGVANLAGCLLVVIPDSLPPKSSSLGLGADARSCWFS
jgi:hypothetical protein